jgi:hypothetical protein
MPENTIVSNSTDKTVSIASKEWLAYLNDERLIPEHPVTIINAGEKKRYTVDALDVENKIVKEFNGCYWHGCPECHPENELKYQETIKRKTLLENQGYRVDDIWECDWTKLKATLPNRHELEQKARDQNINVRDALLAAERKVLRVITNATNIKRFTIMMLFLYILR